MEKNVRTVNIDNSTSKAAETKAKVVPDPADQAKLAEMYDRDGRAKHGIALFEAVAS